MGDSADTALIRLLTSIKQRDDSQWHAPRPRRARTTIINGRIRQSVTHSRSRVHAGIVPPNLGNHSRRRVVRVGLVLDTELGRGLIGRLADS